MLTIWVVKERGDASCVEEGSVVDVVVSVVYASVVVVVVEGVAAAYSVLGTECNAMSKTFHGWRYAMRML